MKCVKHPVTKQQNPSRKPAKSGFSRIPPQEKTPVYRDASGDIVRPCRKCGSLDKTDEGRCKPCRKKYDDARNASVLARKEMRALQKDQGISPNQTANEREKQERLTMKQVEAEIRARDYDVCEGVRDGVRCGREKLRAREAADSGFVSAV